MTPSTWQANFSMLEVLMLKPAILIDSLFLLLKYKAKKVRGVSPRTAFRWNEKWLHEGLITKAEYGVYRKVG